MTIALELINRFKCILSHHEGMKVGRGKVIVTAKKNRPSVPIPGVWDIFECQRHNCKITYAEEVKGK